MSVTSSAKYKTAFKVACVFVPVLMSALGYFYGDIQPVVRDVCGLLQGSERPSVTSVVDAGAPR